MKQFIGNPKNFHLVLWRYFDETYSNVHLTCQLWHITYSRPQFPWRTRVIDLNLMESFKLLPILKRTTMASLKIGKRSGIKVWGKRRNLSNHFPFHWLSILFLVLNYVVFYSYKILQRKRRLFVSIILLVFVDHIFYAMLNYNKERTTLLLKVIAGKDFISSLGWSFRVSKNIKTSEVVNLIDLNWNLKIT